MENNINETENILFESKGIPTKIRNLFFICGVSLLVIGIVGIVITLMQPDYTGYHSSDPQIINGNAVVTITLPSGIRAEERSEYLKLFCVALVAGGLSYSAFSCRRRFYFRIFEHHIEGCSGFWFLFKNFNIPIEQIAELSKNEEGWAPYISICTVHRNNILIYMNKNKVIEAENILRHMLNSQM